MWQVRILNDIVEAEIRALPARVFVKKTQKTPPKELRIARERAKEIYGIS